MMKQLRVGGRLSWWRGGFRFAWRAFGALV